MVRWLAFVGLTMTLLVTSCAREPRTIVLLVVVDTLRADRLGCYGNRTIRTPNLNALAASGIRYENAVSAAPVTLPSITSILTGVYPPQHGIRDNGNFRLSTEWHTLAECLTSEGYESGAFVSADVVASRHGLDQGFSIYDDDFSEPFSAYDTQFRHLVDSHQGIERRANDTVDAALDWIGSADARRLFVFVHLFDPHVWRDPPPPYDALYPEDPYAGEIAYVDREIGRLRDAIGGFDRSLTILTSDHGEGLQTPHAEELHGFLLYRETTRVPLLVAGDDLPKNGTVTSLVRTIDIFPTVCDWARAGVPRACTGRRLPRATESDADLLAAYSETFRPRLSYGWCELRALRTGRWTLIEGPSLELYDEIRDPDERHDLADSLPNVRDDLASRLDSLAFRIVRHASEAAFELDAPPEDLEDRLQSLGYVSGIDTPKPGDTTDIAQRVYLFDAENRGRARGLADPKSRLGPYNRRLEAQTLERAGHAALFSNELLSAIDYFERGLAIDSTSAGLFGGLALALERSGHAEDAIDQLNDARRRFPSDVDIATALAYTQWRAGRQSAAIATLRAAPRVPEVLRTQAIMHLDRGNVAVAVPLLRAAVEASRDDTESWQLLESAYEFLGDREAARACRRELRRLGIDSAS